MLLSLAAVPEAAARKFYTDDPIEKEPPPRKVENVKSRRISDYYDFFHHTLATPGERSTPAKPIPARGVNTLGEVPDGAWYVNRHYRRRRGVEELVAGPDRPGNAPSLEGQWRIAGVKNQGVTPGFTIVDAKGRRYLLKFDPLTNPEMATAADVIGTKFFHALGYHVPENFVVTFPEERLVLDPKTTVEDNLGRKRKMTGRDVTEILLKVPRDANGIYRGTASLYLSGKPVGERRFYGTRKDDPNDTVPHEHRRDLRGFYVFCAWLGHDDSRSINSLDMVVSDDGPPHVRHYLIDFGSILGSASTKANSARSGNEHLFSWKPAIAEALTLGLWAPRWVRASYPDLPSVGLFESEIFDPERYRPEYPNPAFLNRQPDDEFWAARQVMHFTDAEIQAIVKTGRYSDPRAEKWVADCLIERRNKIGRVYFGKVLPLDRFAVRGGRLEFEDLAVTHKLASPREYTISWHTFDNEREQMAPIAGAAGASLPPAALAGGPEQYFAAAIHAGDPKRAVTVYVRHGVVVGIDRRW